MFMRREKENDNRGIALISVMICVMLCFLLSATIMRISLLSYLQKGIGRQASSTFYENESFVDDIKLGVQSKVAEAFATTSIAMGGQDDFVDNFIDAIMDAGESAEDDADNSEKAKLERALYGFIVKDSDEKDVSITIAGDETTGECISVEANGEIVIKGVTIAYTDNTKGGYVSNIKTDIRIRSPYYTHETHTVKKSVPYGNYSLLAGGGAEFGGYNAYSVLTQDGSVYVGYSSYNSSSKVATSAVIKDKGTLKLVGETVTFNGDIYVKDHSTLLLMAPDIVVRGKIYLTNNSHLIISDEVKTLTCQDICISEGSSDSATCYSVYQQTYVKSTANVTDVTGLPTPKGTSYSSKKSCVFAYNSSTHKSTQVLTKTNTLEDDTEVGGMELVRTENGEEVDIIQFDPTKLPVENVPVGDRLIDAELNKILNLEVFLKFCKSDRGDYKNPRSALQKNGYSGEDVYTATKKSIASGDTWAGGETTTFKYDYDTGASVSVLFNAGTNIQIANGKLYQFFIADKDIIFNDQNNAMWAQGIYLSTGKVEYHAKEGESHCYALAQLAMEEDENGNLVISQEYKDYIDKIGLQTYANPNDTAEQHHIVNNFFNGGIKILYETDDSSGGNNEIETDEYTVDSVKNKTIDVVTFENWEKH